MTDTAIPTLNPATGKVWPDLLPASTGAQSVEFGFAGELVARVGVQYWLTPSWATITPKALTAQLGTIPTIGAVAPGTTFTLKANGATIATATILDGNRQASVDTFTAATLPPSTLVTVDITAVPAATPTKAADAVIQFWWEYAE